METINNVLKRLEMSEAAAEVEKVSELIKVSWLRNRLWDFFGGNPADISAFSTIIRTRACQFFAVLTEISISSRDRAALSDLA